MHTNLLKQLDIGQERYEQALSINPNESLAWLLKGTLHAFKGEGEQAVYGTEHALRLSPLDPLRYFYDSLAATAALSAGRTSVRSNWRSARCAQTASTPRPFGRLRSPSRSWDASTTRVERSLN